jgi:Sulfotransferase family
MPDRPLFIGGCPRSGTTLLRCLLDNHPDLGVPAETNFLIPLWRFRARYGDLRRTENRRAVAEWIFNTDGTGGRRIRAGSDRAAAIERVTAAAPTLGSLLAACFEIYAEVHGKPRWGDKRPAYAGFIAALFELFPDAQFVNLVRDPRAAVASQMRVGLHSQDAPLAASVTTWLTSVRRVDAFSRRLRPDQLLDVRYEDMVRDPAGTLRRICDFASLREGDAIEEMLTRERTGKFREGWHTLITQPITTATIDSWRDQLTPAEAALVQRAAAAQFERFGYRPDAELQAVPEHSALRELRHEQASRARKWRRHAREELKRRLYVYRQPVAAQPVPAPGPAAALTIREPVVAAAAR